jgi:hypothetical protein
VDGEDAVITSVLALLGKVRAIRRDPRVALLAGGVQLRGCARVQLDEAGIQFGAGLARQEMQKYPPSRLLLRFPLRRLLWWYSGRAIIRLTSALTPTPGDDRITLTVLAADGLPQIMPVTRVPALDEPVIDLSESGLAQSPADGPACLIVHDEYRGGSDLRQLRLSGNIAGGQLVVRRSAGSLSQAPGGIVAQLAGFRQMAAAARANRSELASWRGEDESTAASELPYEPTMSGS